MNFVKSNKCVKIMFVFLIINHGKAPELFFRRGISIHKKIRRLENKNIATREPYIGKNWDNSQYDKCHWSVYARWFCLLHRP